jgi:hypothetical protein
VLHRSGDAVGPHTYDQEETATPKYTEIRRNMTTPPNTEDIQALEIQELGDAVKRLTKGKCSDLHRIKAKVILHAWGGGGYIKSSSCSCTVASSGGFSRGAGKHVMLSPF